MPPLAGFIVAGALRITLSHHGTFCINSLCHLIGKRTYSNSTARDNWLTALLTFGEGYHNYHHKFPLDYRNGVRFYQFDPTKWLIRGLSYIGLTSNLRRVPKHRIIQVMVETQHKLLADEPQNNKLSALYDSIMSAIRTLREFEIAYTQTKSKDIRRKIKAARVELQTLLASWQQQLRENSTILPAV